MEAVSVMLVLPEHNVNSHVLTLLATATVPALMALLAMGLAVVTSVTFGLILAALPVVTAPIAELVFTPILPARVTKDLPLPSATGAIRATRGRTAQSCVCMGIQSVVRARVIQDGEGISATSPVRRPMAYCAVAMGTVC